MTEKDEDRFRLKLRAPRDRAKAHTSPFVRRVLGEAVKAGHISHSGSSVIRTRPRPCSRIGRGGVAVALMQGRAHPRARRAIVKTRLVVLRRASRHSTAIHLRYIQRDGITREGQRGELYNGEVDRVDAQEFEKRSGRDRHQFRFIVSPEDGVELADLKDYTRELMHRVQRDLGTRLEWVAVDHWDTDNPHTHIVLRGRDGSGDDLVIAGDYIADGLRQRASEVATDWLGLRSELEILRSVNREISQERWTSLDRAIQERLSGGLIDLREVPDEAGERGSRARLIGRLDHLASMGLTEEVKRGIWAVSPQAEATLRTLGERGDIIRTMQRTFTRERREFAFFNSGGTAPVTGRVVAKGLSDELHDQGYLIVDGLDGRAHHVPLADHIDISTLPVGAVVTITGAADPRAADRNIAALAQDGIYRTATHLEVARTQMKRGQSPESFVEAHVRRLEALRRVSVVERVEEGVWRVPSDLPERGQRYDAQRAKGAQVVVNSFVPIEKQTRAVGATWLDRQLLAGTPDWGNKGFATDAKQALIERREFLISQGLAERHGERVLLARNLLATLREKELETTGKEIEANTGFRYNRTMQGTTVSGIYRQSVSLASGRFAMLENGLGFSLVPWRPVIEPKLGREVSAVVSGDSVSWELGRQRGLTR